MATIREEFFSALTKGAKWDVGVSINRTNPLPLDLYSVHESKAKLDAYVAGKFSYPGQILALIEDEVRDEHGNITAEGKTTIYYLDQNKTLQEVGAKIVADEKTITVNPTTGALEIKGFTEADASTVRIPRKNMDGSFEWAALSDVVKGDGNTTYTFALNTGKTGFTITPMDGEVAGTPVSIDFDVYTKAEVDSAIAAAAATAASETKAVADKLVGITSTVTEYVSTEIGKQVHISAEVVEALPAVNDAKEGKIYLLKNDNSAAGEYIEYILVTKDGVKSLEAIGDTTTDLSNYYDKTAADSAISAAITAHETAADAKYATKSYVGVIPEGYSEQKDIIAYIEKKKEEAISAATGSTGETAAEVKAALESHIASNNTSFQGVESQISTINTKLDTVENGAQVNKIETITKTDASKISISTSGTTVTLDDSGLQALITSAQTTANSATEKANAAQNSANAAQESANTNAQSIKNLTDTVIPGINQTVNTLREDHNALAETVAGHTGTLNGLNDRFDAKAEKSTVESLSGTVSGHTGTLADQKSLIDTNTAAIKTINETTIPAVEAKVTKNTQDITGIRNTIGAVTEGKTVVEMISDAKKEATYDDSALSAAVEANTNAITILNGDVTLNGSVKKTVATEVAKILNDNDDSDIDTLEEIAAWITSDTTGAAKMNKDIQTNAGNITRIDTVLNTLAGDSTVSGSILNSIDTHAKKIATGTVLGHVLSSSAENKISVGTDGTMEVNSLNVNKLVQTSGDTLILNGGSATT